MTDAAAAAGQTVAFPHPGEPFEPTAAVPASPGGAPDAPGRTPLDLRRQAEATPPPRRTSTWPVTADAGRGNRPTEVNRPPRGPETGVRWASRRVTIMPACRGFRHVSRLTTPLGEL
ncbi:hypothetical protein SHKM778_38460 [Streptomyces sp. KM77-8]|uniref:Uncharacterized protein n=1 Tax=Streptomyces haneummycinicus TaxID=3074435 RepID=A0AAT9HJM4_9ACTN